MRSNVPNNQSKNAVKRAAAQADDDSSESVSAVPASPPKVATLIKDGVKAVQDYEQDKLQNTLLLEEALKIALTLHQYVKRSKNRRDKLEAELKKNKIRVTARTKNDLTPIVKLIFGQVDKSKVSRYAGALAYADQQGTSGDNLHQFLFENDGIVACAKRYKMADNGSSKSIAADKQATHLELCRRNSISFNSPRFRNATPDGLFSVLVEKNDEGKLRLLGIRGEDAAGSKRFRPVVKKKTK